MNRILTIATLASLGLLAPASAHADQSGAWSLELVPGNNVRLFDADGDFMGGVWIAGTTSSQEFPFPLRNFIAQWTGDGWLETPAPQPSAPAGDHSLEGIAALGPDDAVAVGARDSPGANFSIPQSMRWDGASWTLLSTPSEIADNGNGSGAFVDVARAGDVLWAVGNMPGLVPGGVEEPLLRFFATELVGGQWQAHILPLYDQIANQGLARYRSKAVAGVAADDVWVGGWVQQVGEGPDGPMLARWDGSQWTWSDIWPLFNTPVASIDDIAAVASDDVWAVGDETVNNRTRTVILHWDGSAWSRVPTPDDQSRNASLRTVVARSATEIYAGGLSWEAGGPPEGYLLRYDGQTWSVVPDVELAAGSQFFASAIAGGDTLWLAGLSNEFITGLAQRQTLSDSAANADLNADGVVGPGDLAILVANWGQLGGPADLSGDGVGPDDLAALLAAWGTTSR
jgi:hypothetical protein